MDNLDNNINESPKQNNMAGNDKKQLNAAISGETQKSTTKKGEFLRAVKFLLFSISAGLIQIGSFTLLNELARWSYWPSYLISLTLSVLWNFTLNRKFTFKSAANVPIAMLLVFAYYMVFTPLSTIGGNALTKAGWNEYIVLAITMVLNFVTEFLFCRFVVYRGKVDQTTKPQPPTCEK